MRFTEHEMTTVLTGVAKRSAAAASERRDGVDIDPEQAWASLSRFEQFQVLDRVGDILLPILVALPDVDVTPGTRPTFTGAQIAAAVEKVAQADSFLAAAPEPMRAMMTAGRVLLATDALGHLPIRFDPDALLAADFTVPDSLEGL